MPEGPAARRGRLLDQPKGTGRRLHVGLDDDTFGRFSERLARFFGTARFLVMQSILVVVWIAANVYLGNRQHGNHFDPYPFILLNLAFSTQAAYAAPLILLAQNRQAHRDRVSLEEDRVQNARSGETSDYLAREIAAIRIALGDVATRDFVRSELTRMVETITSEDPEADAGSGGFAPP